MKIPASNFREQFSSEFFKSNMDQQPQRIWDLIVVISYRGDETILHYTDTVQNLINPTWSWIN